MGVAILIGGRTKRFMDRDTLVNTPEKRTDALTTVEQSKRNTSCEIEFKIFN